MRTKLKLGSENKLKNRKEVDEILKKITLLKKKSTPQNLGELYFGEKFIKHAI